MDYLLINTAGARTEFLLRANGGETCFLDESGKSASEILLPQLAAALDQRGVRLDALDFLGCVVGPGSFTGIRIGVSTVRGFCQITGQKALSVCYNRLLSYDAAAENKESIVTVVHGWGDTCYVAAFTQDRECVLSPQAIHYSCLPAFLSDIDESYALICDAAAAKRTGGSVYEAALCMRRFCEANGLYAGDYRSVEPHYIVLSQAERELK